MPVKVLHNHNDVQLFFVLCFCLSGIDIILSLSAQSPPMKSLFFFTLLIAASLSSIAQVTPALQMNPWKEEQLISPQSLAALLDKSGQVKIFNIGVVQNIKGAVNVGAASESANLQKLKAALKNVPKNQHIVIYCGCCPMVKCPNIRPAFQTVTDMKFSNADVLDLHTNIKTDWIDKGYPIDKIR
jgi:thiosulfate/3-mercaptopyruvate sulfurtransferase